MTPPRRGIPIPPELLRRSVDLEISIGAYARKQRRRRMLIGLVGAALIGGALLVYLALAPGWIGHSDDYPVRVICKQCGESEMRIAFRQSYPVQCPKCGNKTAWPLLECHNCRKTFVANASAGEIRCPNCGSLSVGAPGNSATSKPQP